jgi:hypothetical protein
MSWLEDIQNHRKRQVNQMVKAFGCDEMDLQKAEDEVDLFEGEGDSNKLMKQMNKGKEETTASDNKKTGKSNMYKMKMLGLRKFNDQDQKTYIGVEDAENSYITNLDNGDIVISKTDEGYLVSKFPIDENKEGEEKDATDLSEAVDVALQFKEELDNEEDNPEQIMYKETEKAFEDEVNPFEKAAYEAEFGQDIEKAHQDGDMHPNGKWVWRSSANGGKGDWRVASPSKRGGGAKTAASTPKVSPSKLAKRKADFSGFDSKVLKDIIDGKIQNADEVSKQAARELLEDRKKPKVGDVSKLTANEKQMVDKVVSNGFKIVSSKYNDMEKMSLEKTPKGNWRCYYDGKDIGASIVGKLITDSVVKKMRWNKDNKVVHDINGTKVTVTKNTDGSYTLEAKGKKIKSDDPSYFVNGTNLKPNVKKALAKEVGL